jgi:hypothetical protein
VGGGISVASYCDLRFLPFVENNGMSACVCSGLYPLSRSWLWVLSVSSQQDIVRLVYTCAAEDV